MTAILAAPVASTASNCRRICDIDWTRLRYLSGGSYGRVYEVDAQTVIKIGGVSSDEARRQRTLARAGLAVPVLQYRSRLPVRPEQLIPLCHWHSDRRETCYCFDDDTGGLLMARADPDWRSHYTQQDIYDFMDRIYTFCRKKFDWRWDGHNGNVGIYNGHLVAFDMGDW